LYVASEVILFNSPTKLPSSILCIKLLQMFKSVGIHSIV